MSQVSVRPHAVQKLPLPEEADTSLSCSIKGIIEACQPSSKGFFPRVIKCNQLFGKMIETVNKKEGAIEWEISLPPPFVELWENMIHDSLALLEEKEEGMLSSDEIRLLNKICLCIICGLPLHTPVDLSRIIALAVRAREEEKGQHPSDLMSEVFRRLISVFERALRAQEEGQPTFSDLICELLGHLITFGLDPLQRENTKWSWDAVRREETTPDDQFLRWIQYVMDQLYATDQQEYMQLCLNILLGLVKPELVNKQQFLTWLCEQLKCCLWSPPHCQEPSSEASSPPLLIFENFSDPQRWQQGNLAVIPDCYLSFSPYDGEEDGGPDGTVRSCEKCV